MKNLKIILLALTFLWFGVSGASAIPIELFDYGINIDGIVNVPTLGDPVPGEADISLFDDILAGLGTIIVTITGATTHNVDLFVDHKFDQDINTFFNETGSKTGTPVAGQSWEIDEPGFVDGDIFGNFQTSSLDNGIGTSIWGNTTFPDDVSMTMGWDFSLLAGETATLSFLLSQTPVGGFYLTHTDPDSNASIYFSSSLGITGGPVGVPEPTTILLVGTGLIGLIGFGRKKFRKQS